MLNICDLISTKIVSTPFLPLFCVVTFYLSDSLFFVLVQFTTLKLMDQYHCITSSYSTKMSKLFHLTITFIIGVNAWFYHLYDYITLFIVIFLIIITIWILALSNLYPFNNENIDKTKNQNPSTNTSIYFQ